MKTTWIPRVSRQPDDQSTKDNTPGLLRSIQLLNKHLGLHASAFPSHP